MNKVANEQYKANENLFMNAFLELLQTKDISKITVRELCEKTSLNRTTFYNHYLDIYDLLDKIGLEHANKMSAMFNKGHSKSSKANLKIILNYMKEHQLFYRASLKAPISARLKSGFILVVKNSVLSSNLSKSLSVEYQSIFLANGMLSTIAAWLDNNCDLSIDRMCDILNKYVECSK